jgi:transcription initiation factor TFIIF subunit beta
MADPLIKADPDAKVGSPANFADEDIYEDAGDLEFNADPMYQQLYLARVPKYLWDLWSKLDDDAEIEIGTVRQTHHTQNGQQRVGSMYILLVAY